VAIPDGLLEEDDAGRTAAATGAAPVPLVRPVM